MTSARLSAVLLGCAVLLLSACNPNPYAATNRVYKKQTKALTKAMWKTPVTNPGEDSLRQGDYWVGATNFNLRKPNYVVIHHTAQNSTEQTLKTFTMPRTQVSAHYVIGRDGKVYHMLHDNLRAWHGGNARWGNTTDLNSTSIGIELDNNGFEPFQEAQISSLIQVLAILKKTHGIPAANFIGHSDIAPSRKVDPNPTFPWKKLAQAGFGLWYDEEAVAKLVLEDELLTPVVGQDSLSVLGAGAAGHTVAVPAINPQMSLTPPLEMVPAYFNPKEALRIIGYDVRNLESAIKAFKLHFIQTDLTPTLTPHDKKVLFNLYKLYL